MKLALILVVLAAGCDRLLTCDDDFFELAVVTRSCVDALTDTTASLNRCNDSLEWCVGAMPKGGRK